jgi:putative ABC transport system permease protein
VSEAIVLAVLGTVAGALLAKWAVTLAAGSSVTILRLQEATLSGKVIALVSAIAVVAVLLFSVMQLMAGLKAAPAQALSPFGRGLHGSRGEARLRSSLLVAQLSFAVLLTILTGTMAQSLARLQSVPLGYEPDDVFVARLSFPPQKYATSGSLGLAARTLEAEIRNVPGVTAAGAISIAPLAAGLYIIPFDVVGRAPATPNERLEAHQRQVTPGYFDAVGARMVRGRIFSASDDETSSPVAIVSRELATRYFAGVDPIGRQLRVNDNNTGPRPITIVGVVENMRHVRLDAPPEVDVYIPLAQVHPDGAGFLAARQFWVAKVRQGAAEYRRAFTTVLERVDRDIAMTDVERLNRHIEASLAPRRVSVYALFGFAITALILAAVGVYGVVAYSVAQRRREVGLRLALGASRLDVARTFVQPAIVLGAIGIALGVAGALATRRLVAGLLFGVSPTEPVVLGVVALTLLVATGAAAIIPARRATRIDPATTLRD